MISNTVIIVGIVIGSLMLLVLLLIWGLKGKNEVGLVGFFIGFLGTLLVGLSVFSEGSISISADGLEATFKQQATATDLVLGQVDSLVT